MGCGLWVVDIISIMYVAEGVDLLTCGFWTEYQSCMSQELWTSGLWDVDRISIMHVAGGVDLWTCVPVGCGHNTYHVCSRRVKKCVQSSKY